jgi:hypothetical protein
MKYKITALPFLCGSTVVSFISGDWSFPISALIILTVMLFTKQIELH